MMNNPALAQVILWTRLKFINGVELANPPPGWTPILVVDHAGNMAVCVFDPRCNDFLIDFEFWAFWDEFDPVYDGDGNECARSETACYFKDPCAWMPLPPPPVKIMDDLEDSEYAMSHYPLFDAVEATLRSQLLNMQATSEIKEQYRKTLSWGEKK